MRVSLCTILVVFLLAGGIACAGEVNVGVALTDDSRVRVSLWSEGWLDPEGLELFRSTTRFEPGQVDSVGYPVSVLRFPAGSDSSELVDSMVADNATYYYMARLTLRDGSVLWSGVDSVRVPDTELGTITGSSLFIDKLNYFLEVRDGGRRRKRYPVALGRKPRNRKLHQDNASTPEGIYRIVVEQPHATFYKAFDIDYPNGIDSIRYRFARDNGMIAERHGRVPGKGGEIQIHGEGIGRNWTFGCIAMRNEDMDELFDHPRVGRGMPVIIVGGGLTRYDIRSVQDYRTDAELRGFQRCLKDLGHYEGEPDGVIGSGTRFALGRLQRTCGIPVTCDFDARTLRILRAE